jgi:hypothetical protein
MEELRLITYPVAYDDIGFKGDLSEGRLVLLLR